MIGTFGGLGYPPLMVNTQPIHPRDLLTREDLECLRLVAEGHTSKEIAVLLGVSHHTVDSRMKRATAKLGVPRRIDAARLIRAAERNDPPPTPEWKPSVDKGSTQELDADDWYHQSPEVAGAAGRRISSPPSQGTREADCGTSDFVASSQLPSSGTDKIEVGMDVDNLERSTLAQLHLVNSNGSNATGLFNSHGRDRDTGRIEQNSPQRASSVPGAIHFAIADDSQRHIDTKPSKQRLAAESRNKSNLNFSQKMFIIIASSLFLILFISSGITAITNLSAYCDHSRACWAPTKTLDKDLNYGDRK